MGYNKSNSKQQNTYIGETSKSSPLLGLASQIQSIANQRKAQQNLLFGGQGYGGSFQTPEQKAWDPKGTSPYPSAKPYGGWGGFGSDNKVANPSWYPQTPAWPGPGGLVPGGSGPVGGSAQRASLNDLDGSQNSLQQPVPGGLTMIREERPTVSTNQGRPNMQESGPQPGTAAYEMAQQKASLGGPSGGPTSEPTYPFSYQDRAKQIKDMMARKPGAYSEGAQETLLNRLASPFSDADPGVEEGLRAMGQGRDGYTLKRFTNTQFDPTSQAGSLGGTQGGPEFGSSGVPGMPGYGWVKNEDADPAKWRRGAGF